MTTTFLKAFVVGMVGAISMALGLAVAAIVLGHIPTGPDFREIGVGSMNRFLDCGTIFVLAFIYWVGVLEYRKRQYVMDQFWVAFPLLLMMVFTVVAGTVVGVTMAIVMIAVVGIIIGLFVGFKAGVKYGHLVVRWAFSDKDWATIKTEAKARVKARAEARSAKWRQAYSRRTVGSVI